jgi:hypothetical protein
MKLIKTGMRVALMAVVAVAAFSCSNEFARSSSPVELIVTNTQDIQQIDLNGNGTSGNTKCNDPIGEIKVEARLKAPDANTDQRFNDVRITRYRVSYVRTDGGTAVPAPFVRSMDALITAGGGSTSLTSFVVLTSDSVSQAPFTSLQPNNGGRDPQTGRPVVRMDVVVEVFGETLSGTNVSGTTRFPLDFCFQCGGCG